MTTVSTPAQASVTSTPSILPSDSIPARNNAYTTPLHAKDPTPLPNTSYPDPSLSLTGSIYQPVGYPVGTSSFYNSTLPSSSSAMDSTRYPYGYNGLPPQPSTTVQPSAPSGTKPLKAKSSRNDNLSLNIIHHADAFGTIVIDKLTDKLDYVRKTIMKHFNNEIKSNNFNFLSKDGIDIKPSQEKDIIAWSQAQENVYDGLSSRSLGLASPHVQYGHQATPSLHSYP